MSLYLQTSLNGGAGGASFDMGAVGGRGRK